MIRINLLPRKKKKARSSASIESDKIVGIGFGAIAVVAAAVFFLVHSPMQDDLENQASANARRAMDNKKIQERTQDFDKLKAAFEAAQAQMLAIEELNNARATPANFLHELAMILKPGGEPTMTAEMVRRLDQNENLRWQEGWNPKHVWIESLFEKDGQFTLRGSAQSDGDATQLAHRLQASTYFQDAQPQGSVKKTEGTSGITVYSFQITGKVRY